MDSLSDLGLFNSPRAAGRTLMSMAAKMPTYGQPDGRGDAITPAPNFIGWGIIKSVKGYVNLSFHTDFMTCLHVITPFTVSNRWLHVASKSTRFGFNDIPQTF